MDKQVKEHFVYALVTTRARVRLLKERSLKSIIKQSHPVDTIILVDDSDEQETQASNMAILESLKTSIPKVYLKNKYTPGAAGAWNTGIDYINEKNPNVWIAFLDDDDEWKEEHVETCLQFTSDNVTVISGIKTIIDGNEIVRKKVKSNFSVAGFFAGNPGWQGSNTFIKAFFIKSVGSFDEKMVCTHDRDLAVRCLSNPLFKYSFTNKTTVNYYLDKDRDALTSKKKVKTTGLLQFWEKYHNIMNEKEKSNFIIRACKYFKVNPILFQLLLQKEEEHHGFLDDTNIHYGYLINKFFHLKYNIKKFFLFINKLFLLTNIKGYAYNRSHSKIEIDITYNCSLKCINCNRSCGQAPEKLHISLEKVKEFVDESIERKIEWKTIRILGGEPTLHPNFTEIIYMLVKYKIEYPKSRLEIVTNGYGRNTKRMITHIPPLFHIENSKKTTNIQPHFEAFNNAPQDSFFYKFSNYKNGCSNLVYCGIGLTPLGYYPCSIAGGIDRIVSWKIGRKNIPAEDDDLRDILERSCRLCGRFRSSVFVPYNFRKKLNKAIISKSWKELYASWKTEKKK